MKDYTTGEGTWSIPQNGDSAPLDALELLTLKRYAQNSVSLPTHIELLTLRLIAQTLRRAAEDQAAANPCGECESNAEPAYSLGYLIKLISLAPLRELMEYPEEVREMVLALLEATRTPFDVPMPAHRAGDEAEEAKS